MNVHSVTVRSPFTLSIERTVGLNGQTFSEADLLNVVTDAASLFNWEWIHHRPARTVRGWRTPVSGSLGIGWPDLILVRGSRVIGAELKAERGRVTPDQTRVLALLQGAGIPTYIVRPSTLDDFLEVLR